MQVGAPGKAPVAWEARADFRQWLVNSSTHTVWIWTIMLVTYLCTLLNKGAGGPGSQSTSTKWQLGDAANFQIVGTYLLLGITCVMAIANKLRSVPMIRLAFLAFGVLQAAMTIEIGLSKGPVPRMLELESELGLEFLSNLVVAAQLIIIDFDARPRLLFMAMHILSLVPFYMRVLSYGITLSSVRAVGVYGFVYLAYTIIKRQLDGCYSQHLQRQQAEPGGPEAGAEGRLGLPGKGVRHSVCSCVQLIRMRSPSLVTGMRLSLRPLQLHGQGRGCSQARSTWLGHVDACTIPAGLEQRGEGQVAAAPAANGALGRLAGQRIAPLLRRIQVHWKLHGGIGPEHLAPDALDLLRNALLSRVRGPHVLGVAVRKGSLILSLELFEPLPGQQAEGEQPLHVEDDISLCNQLQAAAFEWCKASGVASLLTTGNLLTLQVNQQLRSCFWDASLVTWTPQLASEMPDHAGFNISLDTPALFLPHLPGLLCEQQRRRQQLQQGAPLLPHQQLHMEVTCKVHVTMPSDCVLVGWDYPGASHNGQQQQQQQQQQQGGRAPCVMQLLARASGSFLPVTVVCQTSQPHQDGVMREVQVHVSLPLSLVQSAGCSRLSLELWHPGDTLPSRASGTSSSTSGDGDGGAPASAAAAATATAATPHSLSCSLVGGLHGAGGAKDSGAAGARLEREAVVRAMVSSWLDGTPSPPDSRHYARAVASAPLLLLPVSLVTEVTELEAWALGMLSPQGTLPAPAEVASFLWDLGDWLAFSHARKEEAGGGGRRGEQAGEGSSVTSDASSSSSSSSSSNSQGARALPASEPPVPPTAKYERHSDQSMRGGRAGADMAMPPLPQRAASFSAQAKRGGQDVAAGGGQGAKEQGSAGARDGMLNKKAVATLEAVEAMAEVGRALLHHAARTGLVAVAGTVLQLLMEPPYGKPFAWVVREEGDEDEQQQQQQQQQEEGEAEAEQVQAQEQERGSGGSERGAAGAADVAAAGSAREEGRDAACEQERETPVSMFLRKGRALGALGRGSMGAWGAGSSGGSNAKGRGGPNARRPSGGPALGGGSAPLPEPVLPPPLPPLWMRQPSTKNGGLPTCFSFSPFAAPTERSPAQGPPMQPGRGNAPDPRSLRSSSMPVTRHIQASAPPPPPLLPTRPSPKVHPQQLLHCALLSGQPQMVQAVLGWGHAQPHWVWRMDQEDTQGISPRRIAEAMPQRDVLLPLLLGDAPGAQHAQQQRAHMSEAGGAAGPAGQHGHSPGGIHWGDAQCQQPRQRQQRQAPNFARRGWFQADEGQPLPPQPQQQAGDRFGCSQPGATAHEGEVQLQGPNFARMGWFQADEQQQQQQQQQQQDPPLPQAQPPTHTGRGGTFSRSTYTGLVASAVPSRLAYYSRCSAPDGQQGSHNAQGSSADGIVPSYGRCSAPAKEKSTLSAMGSITASLSWFARRSRGILLPHLDSSYGFGGSRLADPALTNTASSVTASSVTLSSTLRSSDLSRAPSVYGAPHAAAYPSPLSPRRPPSTRASSLSLQQQQQQPLQHHRSQTSVNWLALEARPSLVALLWAPVSHMLSSLCAALPGHSPQGAASPPARPPPSLPGAAPVLSRRAVRPPGQAAPGVGSSGATPRPHISSRLGHTSSPDVPAALLDAAGSPAAAAGGTAAGTPAEGWGRRTAMLLSVALMLGLAAAFAWGGGEAVRSRGEEGRAAGPVGGCAWDAQHAARGLPASSGLEAMGSRRLAWGGDGVQQFAHPDAAASAGGVAPQQGEGGVQGQGQGPAAAQRAHGAGQSAAGAGAKIVGVQLPSWEEGCVLLGHCTLLSFAHCAGGCVPQDTCKVSMAFTKLSYLHLVFRAPSSAAVQDILWLAYVDILVALFIAALSKQLQVPVALAKLATRVATLLPLLLALGKPLGQAMLTSLLLGGLVVSALTGGALGPLTG